MLVVYLFFLIAALASGAPGVAPEAAMEAAPEAAPEASFVEKTELTVQVMLPVMNFSPTPRNLVEPALKIAVDSLMSNNPELSERFSFKFIYR